MATSKKKRRSTAAAAAVSSAAASVADEEELDVEYQYVRKDLRQLALVSLVLFAVMLGIGLFI